MENRKFRGSNATRNGSINSQKGGPSNLENYRPISLLQTAYKFVAALMKERLDAGIDKFVHKTQYGSRRARSTAQAIAIARRLLVQDKEPIYQWSEVGGWAQSGNRFVSCRARMRAVCMSSQIRVKFYGWGLPLFLFILGRCSLFPCLIFPPTNLLSSFSWLYRYC